MCTLGEQGDAFCNFHPWMHLVVSVCVSSLTSFRRPARFWVYYSLHHRGDCSSTLLCYNPCGILSKSPRVTSLLRMNNRFGQSSGSVVCNCDEPNEARSTSEMFTFLKQLCLPNFETAFAQYQTILEKSRGLLVFIHKNYYVRDTRVLENWPLKCAIFITKKKRFPIMKDWHFL